MRLITYSDDEQARQPLIKTAADYGFDVTVVSGEFRFYKDWETRLKVVLAELERLESLGDQDEIVCITDAHDVFINNTADTISKLYDDNYRGLVVFQSEHQVWPDFRLAHEILDHYKDRDGYSYPCFGCVIGPVHRLIDLYRRVAVNGEVDDWIKQHNAEITWPFDDQLALSKLYPTHSWIVIDSSCLLFQSMQAPALPDCQLVRMGTNGEAFLLNSKKNTRPCIVHGHGPVGVKEVYFDVLGKLGHA